MSATCSRRAAQVSPSLPCGSKWQPSLFLTLFLSFSNCVASGNCFNYLDWLLVGVAAQPGRGRRRARTNVLDRCQIKFLISWLGNDLGLGFRQRSGAKNLFRSGGSLAGLFSQLRRYSTVLWRIKKIIFFLEIISYSFFVLFYAGNVVAFPFHLGLFYALRLWLWEKPSHQMKRQGETL